MPTHERRYLLPADVEDEVLLIATAGELPEVALAESLAHLGESALPHLRDLEDAVERCYLSIIVRDLSPENRGRGHFRGLERAQTNLKRLENFLARRKRSLSPKKRRELAVILEGYLEAEAAGLAAGRTYAGAPASVARELARRLELDTRPWEEVLERLAALPYPDFLGQAALVRLLVPGAVESRRRDDGDRLRLSTLDENGRELAHAFLPLEGTGGGSREENRARIEMVWALLTRESIPPHPAG